MTQKPFCCPHCGGQIPEPEGLGDEPLEEIVASDDSIRNVQIDLARRGKDYRHSVMIAAAFPAFDARSQ